MFFLSRIDRTRNIDRFYFVTVLPNLFGDWTVMREWGRRGIAGSWPLAARRLKSQPARG
jgi:predicted DNA-binding WGR domain protein